MTTVARAQRVTPFMLLLTSFMILMHRYTGDEDIAVASAVARRRTLEWQSVIGLLMNGVVLRARVQNSDTCDAVLKRVRDVALQAYDNQEIPHGEVRRAVGAPETHEERARQVFFHCAPRVRPQFPGVESTIVATATSCAKSDFGMSLYDEVRSGKPVRWSGLVEYNDGLFDRPAIARIVQEFQDVLAKVCAGPGQSVGSVV
jgi:non-ribosomal peptide synthetase component F